MARRNTEVDPVNLPIIMARNIAYQQVRYLLDRLPNPIGQIDPQKLPSRFGQDEFERLDGRI